MRGLFAELLVVMHQVKKRTIQKVMRNLHRDIGFLMIGLTLLFSVSGVVLIYRDTNFFTYIKQVNETIPANLDSRELAHHVPFRRFTLTNVQGDLLYFNQGTYNLKTGELRYEIRTYPWIIKKFNHFHRSISREATHWIATLYGVLLLFLALSSFWMYKPNTNNFKRGLIISGLGIVFVIVLLFII